MPKPVFSVHAPLPFAIDNRSPHASDSELTPPRSVVSAGVGDPGLAGLGLLMQLTGGLMAIVATTAFVIALSWLEAGDAKVGCMLLVLGSSIARSIVHCRAGTVLLYRGTEVGLTPLTGIWRYVAVASIQSIFVAAMLRIVLHADAFVALGVGLGLAIWPGVLALIFSLPRFRRFNTEISTSSDRGREGVAMYMLMFGALGVAIAAWALFNQLVESRFEVYRPIALLKFIATGALLVRSVVHVRSGLLGLRAPSFTHSIEHSQLYSHVAIIATVVLGFALLLQLLVFDSVSFVALACIVGVCLALFVWPLALRRLVEERQFAADMEMSDEPDYARSPDAGLTWLGWLLIGSAAASLTFVVPALFTGDGDRVDEASGLFAGIHRMHQLFLLWTMALAVFKAWAGFDLVWMRARARMVTTAYCIGAAATALWMWNTVAVIIVVVSSATLLWLVRRKVPLLVPTAVARLHKS